MRARFSGRYAAAGVCLSSEQNHPGEPGEESDKDGERRKERGGELTLKQHNKETTPRTGGRTPSFSVFE